MREREREKGIEREREEKMERDVAHIERTIEGKRARAGNAIREEEREVNEKKLERKRDSECGKSTVSNSFAFISLFARRQR